MSVHPFVVGMGAGAVTALGVWYLATRKLDARLTAGADDLNAALGAGHATLTSRLAAGRQQLDERVRTQVEDEVPPRVQIAMAQTLAQYGITPETGRNISLALAAAQRAGLLGVRRA